VKRVYLNAVVDDAFFVFLWALLNKKVNTKKAKSK